MKYTWHKDNVPNPEKSQWEEGNRAWYKERNKQLLVDRQEKTFRELSEMYGLSTSRILALIKSTRNKFIGT